MVCASGLEGWFSLAHKHKQVRTPEHKHKSIRRRSINKTSRYQLSSTTVYDQDGRLTLMLMLISLAFALRHKYNISITQAQEERTVFVLFVPMLMLMSWVFSLACASENQPLVPH